MKLDWKALFGQGEVNIIDMTDSNQKVGSHVNPTASLVIFPSPQLHAFSSQQEYDDHA